MPTTRRFCPKCGSKLDPKTGLCPHCDAASPERPAARPASSENASQKPPRQKRPKRGGKGTPPKPTRAERRAQKAAEKEARLASMTLWQRAKRITLIVLGTLLASLVVLAIGFGALEYFGLVDVPPVTYAMKRVGLEPQNTAKTDPMEDLYVPEEDELSHDESQGVDYVNDIVLVTFSAKATDAQRDEAVASIQGEIVGATPEIYQYQVKVAGPKTYDELKSLASTLTSTYDFVSYASPDLAILKVDQATSSQIEAYAPNDPWGGTDAADWKDDTVDGKNYWAEAVDVAKAWAYQDLIADMPVGIADTGFDVGHEDLTGRLEFIDKESESQNHISNWFLGPRHHDDHGTRVAGIASAHGDNELGMTGVAKDATTLVASYPYDFISGYSMTNSMMYANLAKLVAGGAKVINFSQGSQANLSAETPIYSDEVLEQEATSAALMTAILLDQGYDFVVVQSAGNGFEANGKNVAADAIHNLGFCSITKDTPLANTEHTIDDVLNRVVVVGAAQFSNGSFTMTDFSGFGEQVSIFAPGKNVYSTVPTYLSGIFRIGGPYTSAGGDGTSFAAPIVTGVCALTWGADPSLTGAEVKELVCSNTKYDVAPNPSTSNTKGSRLVNAQLAVEAALKGAGKLKDDGTTISIPGGSSEPSRERDVVLVLDTSGSMQGTPINETRTAASKFVDSILGEGANIGIVSYSGNAETIASISTSNDYLQDAIGTLRANGNTNIDEGLQYAASMLSSSRAEKQAIVLMSDGEPNAGRTGDELVAYANQLKNKGITIYTLGFFQALDDKAAAQALMEDIASDGCHYEVASSEDLVYFFGDVADQLNGTRYIYVRIDCPVDVTVSNEGQTLSSAASSYNLRTDFGTLTFEESGEAVASADAADMSGTDTTKILRLKEGPAYELNIQGTGTGTMDYQIGFMDDDNDYTDFRHFEDIAITPATRVDTVAQLADESRLDIDEDGDGHYDLRLRAEANGYGEKIEAPVGLYAMFGIGVACVVVAIPLLIHAVKVRNRLNRAKQMVQR